MECGCCEGKEDRGDLTRVKGPGMGQCAHYYDCSYGGDSMMRACFDAQSHRIAGARPDGTRNMTVFRRLGDQVSGIFAPG